MPKSSKVFKDAMEDAKTVFDAELLRWFERGSLPMEDLQCNRGLISRCTFDGCVIYFM